MKKKYFKIKRLVTLSGFLLVIFIIFFFSYLA